MKEKKSKIRKKNYKRKDFRSIIFDCVEVIFLSLRWLLLQLQTQ